MHRPISSAISFSLIMELYCIVNRIPEMLETGHPDSIDTLETIVISDLMVTCQLDSSNRYDLAIIFNSSYNIGQSI